MPLHKYQYEPTLKPAPISHNTVRKQFLRAKGWIPPKDYSPPSQQSYYAHPITPSSQEMARMRYAFPLSQRTLYILRIAQIVLAVTYLILVAYSGVHHGWWRNLSQPLGFGISASLLTILISIPTILGYASTTATSSVRNYLLHFTRVISEWILIALWAAAFITMLLPKGKDFKLLFERPPYAEWDVAAVLAAVEVVLFVYTMVLVLQEKYLEDPDPFQATVELTRRRRRGQ